MKIIGFAQLHEELRKGNLENWYRSLSSVCDSIYVWDQASTDGSLEFYGTHGIKYIANPNNDFGDELICKSKLLARLLCEEPDVNWIFWMDGDTIIESNMTREALESALASTIASGCSLGHYNLWRSEKHYRIDSGFHALHEHGVKALWRNTGGLVIPRQAGMHAPQTPSLPSIDRLPFSLIHRGFCFDEYIIERLLRYKEVDTVGWPSKYVRFADGPHLEVRELPEGSFPEWCEIVRTDDPRKLPPLDVSMLGW